MKKNYYKVTIPVDVTDDIERAGLLAIDEAEQSVRTYKMPCQWTAKLVKQTSLDYVFVVTRLSN